VLSAAHQSKVELAFARALFERLTSARALGWGAEDWSTALRKVARKPRVD
jgi:hypothetical protein